MVILAGGGGGSQIWSGYGCKACPPTGWGIRWEHRLKKWGVIGWEHDFWHSVREKYKNMWGHRVRAKSSQKSSFFGWYLKQSIARASLILQWCYYIGITWTWLVFSILDCKITKVKYIVFFSNASFSNHGALSDRLNEKNMGLWVRAHATVKNMGSMGDSDAEKGGLLSLTYASPPEWDCPPPPGSWIQCWRRLKNGTNSLRTSRMQCSH